MANLSEIVTRSASNGTVDAALVLECRRAIYGAGLVVTRDQAEGLLALNAQARTRCPEWHVLYAEALTDYLVRQASPAGYVAIADTAWLMNILAGHGVPLDDSDLDMILHVLEAADQTPAPFSAYVLDQAAQRCAQSFRATGAITDQDVERLRRALYATGSADNVAVTHVEAERLFALNAVFRGAPVNPKFDELFARAIGNAVLYEPLWRADATRETHDQAWLADRHPFMLKALLGDHRFGADMEEGLREVARADFESHAGDQQFAADQATEDRAEQLTADEAHWLTDLFTKDGGADPREQMLFRFLRVNARHVDASLDLPSRIQAPVQGAPHAVFGHRLTPPSGR